MSLGDKGLSWSGVTAIPVWKYVTAPEVGEEHARSRDPSRIVLKKEAAMLKLWDVVAWQTWSSLPRRKHHHLTGKSEPKIPSTKSCMYYVLASIPGAPGHVRLCCTHGYQRTVNSNTSPMGSATT